MGAAKRRRPQRPNAHTQAKILTLEDAARADHHGWAQGADPLPTGSLSAAHAGFARSTTQMGGAAVTPVGRNGRATSPTRLSAHRVVVAFTTAAVAVVDASGAAAKAKQAHQHERSRERRVTQDGSMLQGDAPPVTTWRAEHGSQGTPPGR